MPISASGYLFVKSLYLSLDRDLIGEAYINISE